MALIPRARRLYTEYLMIWSFLTNRVMTKVLLSWSSVKLRLHTEGDLHLLHLCHRKSTKLQVVMVTEIVAMMRMFWMQQAGQQPQRGRPRRER